MTINDPRQYVLAGMAEMGLADFFQACAEACSHLAGSTVSPDQESAQAHARKLRQMEHRLLALMSDAKSQKMHFPFVLREG